MKKILGLIGLVAGWCLCAGSAYAQVEGPVEVGFKDSDVTIDGTNVSGVRGSGNCSGNLIVTADGWLNATTTLYMKGQLSIAAGTTLTINSANGTQSSGEIQFEKAAINSSGTVILEKGSIQVKNVNWLYDGTAYGNLIMKNGTRLAAYNAAGSHYLNVDVSKDDTVTFSTGNNLSSYRIDGNLTGGGTINRTMGANEAQTIALAGDNSGFTGTFNMVNGRTYLGSSSAGSAAATWNMESTTAALASDGLATGSTVALGTLSGSGILQNNGKSGESGNLVTFQVGGKNTDATFTGTIRDGNANAQLGLEKVGSATWTLDGATLAYTGPTIVTGGVLKVANTGDVSLGSAVTLGANGTLDLGAGTYDLGALTANGGTINLAINSENDYTRLTVDSITSQDYGFLNPVFGGGMNPYDFTYEIFTTTPTGLPTDFDWNLLLAPEFRYQWNLVQQGTGWALSADRNAIPEPGAWLLMTLGVVFLWRRSCGRGGDKSRR